MAIEVPAPIRRQAAILHRLGRREDRSEYRSRPLRSQRFESLAPSDLFEKHETIAGMRRNIWIGRGWAIPQENTKCISLKPTRNKADLRFFKDGESIFQRNIDNSRIVKAKSSVL
ncbi:MAG TPA: hypothetical protein VMF32_25670, partial [Xanthobacteraceae bacterium]|nr:hypothetical protein [Xanthobacteraceae bacterium]